MYYYQVIRFSSTSGGIQPTPIYAFEWQQFIEQDPTLQIPHEPITALVAHTATYFSDTEDTQGMHWQLKANGRFSFQSSEPLAEDHPYLRKMQEVATGLAAQVQVSTIAPSVTTANHKNTKDLYHQAPSSPVFTRPVSFAKPQELRQGRMVEELKAQSLRKLAKLQLTKTVKENPLVAEVKLDASELLPGGSWQATLVAPTEEGVSFYEVKNIWLELLSLDTTDGAYTFRIQTAFMVELPQVVYLYKQGSKIVVGEAGLVIS